MSQKYKDRMTLRQVPCEHTRKNGKEAIGLKYKLQYLENQPNLKQGKKIMDRLYLHKSGYFSTLLQSQIRSNIY